jgi:putative glutamine amidotransferase
LLKSYPETTVVKVGVTFCGESRIHPYEAALLRAGITPVRLFPSKDNSLHGFAGLLLTGGVDINPELYGQSRAPETQVPDEERDRSELALLSDAIENNLPVFAICRGMQLLNVHRNGTLIQHLPNTAHHEQRNPDEIAGRHRTAHLVEVAPGSRLEHIVNASQIPVNSRHHQAVDSVGAGLTVTARSDDGIVEAVELPHRRFVLGVQWHPEDRVEFGETDSALFAAFAQEVSR